VLPTVCRRSLISARPGGPHLPTFTHGSRLQNRVFTQAATLASVVVPERLAHLLTVRGVGCRLHGPQR
jgi:hypothetical protein